jgi:predicted nucleic acid-binding protein
MIAVDTNVFVYTVDSDDAAKQNQAIRLVQSLYEGETPTFLMWQVCGEYIQQLRRRQQKFGMNERNLRQLVSGVRELFPLVIPTERIIDRALDLVTAHTLSHWDAMLVAACLEAGVDTLYTEDMGAPRMIESLKLINPFATSPAAAP